MDGIRQASPHQISKFGALAIFFGETFTGFTSLCCTGMGLRDVGSKPMEFGECTAPDITCATTHTEALDRSSNMTTEARLPC